MKKNYFLAVLMAISWGAHSQNTAVQFDGVNDIAEITIGYAPVPIDPESFAIEAIIKPGQTGSNMTIFHSFHAQGSIEFGIDANMNPYFYHSREDHIFVAEEITIDPEECQHIAVSVSHGHITFYHNGYPHSHHALGTQVSFPNQTKFYLGNDSQGQNPYAGVIDEFRIWPVARDDGDIAQYAFKTPGMNQGPLFLLLTFWEGAGTFSSDFYAGTTNHAHWDAETSNIHWVEPCVQLEDFGFYAERVGQSPNPPCVPDANNPLNLSVTVTLNSMIQY